MLAFFDSFCKDSGDNMLPMQFEKLLNEGEEYPELKDPIKHLRKGDWKKAAKSLREASDKIPDNYYAWCLLGVSLRMTDKLEDALEAFKKAGNMEYMDTYYINIARIEGAMLIQKIEQKKYGY